MKESWLIVSVERGLEEEKQVLLDPKSTEAQRWVAERCIKLYEVALKTLLER